MFAACIAVAAFAQPQEGGHKHQGGKPDFEKIKAQQVAFITDQVGLTSKEAEAFWPVYNKIEEQQKELRKAEADAYKALDKALTSGEGNVETLLNNYIKAKEANVNLHVKNAKDYKKILSAEKAAKFFACEEKFRRQQIGRVMGGGHGPQGGPGMTGGHRGHKGHMGAPGQGFGPRGGKEFKGDKNFKGDKDFKGDKNFKGDKPENLEAPAKDNI